MNLSFDTNVSAIVKSDASSRNLKMFILNVSHHSLPSPRFIWVTEIKLQKNHRSVSTYSQYIDKTIKCLVEDDIFTELDTFCYGLHK